MSKIKIVTIDKNNISEYPPRCFLNPKNEGYIIKKEWLKKRFSEGMNIKQLYLENEKKAVSFIEYIPGEYAWRAVDTKEYMFIHCLWTSKNTYKNQGHASLLIDECINDAKKLDMAGVAVITSEGPFMAGKEIFLKNGFKSVASEKPSFELMVKEFKTAETPKFMNWKNQLEHYDGLHIIYSDQCPWVSRFITELDEIQKKENINLTITKLRTAAEAQHAPSVYASFNLIYNRKLLADHYISKTRFLNIIKKEIH